MKVKKQIKKLWMNVFYKFKTQKFRHQKYYFEKCTGSNVLIVSFSGFPGASSPAVYNYVKTLKSVKANKLFLLDDYGCADNIGSYYLGENGNWFLVNDIVDLAEETAKKYGIGKTVMIGSSKGGTSALYYAVLCHADAAIVGAPQYHIGRYLSEDKHLPIMKAICGDSSPSSREKLDALLPTAIRECRGKKPEIYLHFSPKEHTYDEHIKDMIEDLTQAGFMLFPDSDHTYTEHRDVAKHFPAYLLRTIGSITE